MADWIWIEIWPGVWAPVHMEGAGDAGDAGDADAEVWAIDARDLPY